MLPATRPCLRINTRLVVLRLLLSFAVATLTFALASSRFFFSRLTGKIDSLLKARL